MGINLFIYSIHFFFSFFEILYEYLLGNGFHKKAMRLWRKPSLPIYTFLFKFFLYIYCTESCDVTICKELLLQSFGDTRFAIEIEVTEAEILNILIEEFPFSIILTPPYPYRIKSHFHDFNAHGIRKWWSNKVASILPRRRHKK